MLLFFKFSFHFSADSSCGIGRLWMDSLNSVTLSLQEKELELENSLQTFSRIVYHGFDEKRTEERTSFEEYKKSCRQKKGITKKLWAISKKFFNQ